MSSLPPAECCTKFNLHEGTPAGAIETVHGVSAYVTGKEHLASGRVIVIYTDIFGHQFLNNQLVADGLARGGYYVVVPDLFEGDPVHPDTMKSPEAVAKFRLEWYPKHFPAAGEIATAFVNRLAAALQPVFLGAIGHCFGAWIVVDHLVEGSVVTAGAIAHPSAVSEEALTKVSKPIIIAAAEVDTRYPPEFRTKSEAILAANKVRYVATLFLGTAHGFAVRGDPRDPVVKYAKEKTLADQLLWFSQF